MQFGEALTSGSAISNVKKVTKDEMEKRRKESNRMVKGVFRCHEPRGGNVTLCWREFKGDPVRRFSMFDGVEYEVPAGLAKHLNTNCNYNVHSHILAADGTPAVDKKQRSISRMNFESLEFYQ